MATYSEYRNRLDNGVIRVGGGGWSCRNINISTYGSMIHIRGWVEFVATIGYGDLYNGGSNNYKKYFNGTSSATPLAASVTVAVQS